MTTYNDATAAWDDLIAAHEAAGVDVSESTVELRDALVEEGAGLSEDIYAGLVDLAIDLKRRRGLAAAIGTAMGL